MTLYKHNYAIIFLHREYLARQSMLRYGINIDLNEWHTINAQVCTYMCKYKYTCTLYVHNVLFLQNIPRQQNGHDCGMFVLEVCLQ